ncbi:unnamed protein product, partial [Ilex paraguariensis]
PLCILRDTMQADRLRCPLQRCPPAMHNTTLMLTLNVRSVLSPCRFHNLQRYPITPFLSFCSSLASITHLCPHHHSQSHTSPPSPEIPNPILLNYLIDSLGFPKPRAFLISNRFSWIKTSEKPQSVVEFLKDVGLSNTHIRSSVHVTPQILVSDIEKTLKPKVEFFLELGISGSEFGKFISKNSSILTSSLDKKLKPCIVILKKILVNGDRNKDLIRVLWRGCWLTAKDPQTRLLSNVLYLESCGIAGSQLSMLLKRQPRLFIMRHCDLKNLVSKVLDMGFVLESRMLVHGLYTVSCMSSDRFMKKLHLFQSFGFSEIECMDMFRRTPGLLRTSEEKLKLGIQFFMNNMKFDKTVLVRNPTCLMHSMKERVIPRYRVLQIIASNRLLKKQPSFITLLMLPEVEFLEKFISRFIDDAEQLLMAYNGHVLDFCE